MSEQAGCLSQVKDKIKHLATEAKRLLLAVSGGADSVALLRALLNSGYQLEVAHLDHALRDSSLEDCAFVKQLCETHAVPFHSERIDVAAIAKEKKWNLEDAARRLRYSFLTRVAKEIQADVIVTAHNQDDQAETVLMQMLRGAAFLKGMPARQKQVIRPLLECSREAIESYLSELGQEFVTDEMNFDTHYTRVWLRQDVLPMLAEKYPNIKEKLAQLADVQSEQEVHFDNNMLGHSVLDVRDLLKMDRASQRHEIARGLARAHLPPTYNHIESIRASLNSKTPKRISLPKGKQARIAYGQLEIIDKVSKVTTISQPILDKQTLEVALKSIHVQLVDLENEVDVDKLLEFPELQLRTRLAGDRLRLEVGSKKLKEILIDKKIPKEDRDAIHLIASHNEVLWVEHICADSRVKSSKQSVNADLYFMQLALAEAQKAFEKGELPVGAVLVKDGTVVASGHNLTETLQDPSAHAEVLVMREAAKQKSDWRLSHATLYVTLEPCVMCFGAMMQAHVPKVVYGASNTLEGAHGGVADLQRHTWKRQIEVKSGILAKESEMILKDFFKSKR